MATYQIKLGWGILVPSLIVCDESGNVRYRMTSPWFGWDKPIKDEKGRQIGTFRERWFRPLQINHGSLGTPTLCSVSRRGDIHELVFPEGKVLTVRKQSRKIQFVDVEQEIAIAKKHFWSHDHIYEIEVEEYARSFFILLAVGILGKFGGSGGDSD